MAKVLVVDDERGIRDLLADDLLEAGYDVVEAGNGAAALDKVGEGIPDIILLDLIMPVMSGFEVLGKLRENPATKAIPVVLLTALPAQKAESQGMRLGVAHYISKPWAAGTVTLAIKIALREASARTDETIDVHGSMLCQGTTYQPTTPDLSEPPTVIRTGSALLDRKLEGGIPLGSLSLIEGPSSSGKSVLCQHLTYETLVSGQAVAYYTSQQTPTSLILQMASIGMDVLAYHESDRLRIQPVKKLNPGGDPEILMALLPADVERLPDTFELIIVDDIANLASQSQDRDVIGLFSHFMRLCKDGRTVILVSHSYAFEENMVIRLRALCDAHLSLGVEKVGTRLVDTLEVRKFRNAELKTDNMVSFEVEAGVGMRIMPMSKVKA